MKFRLELDLESESSGAVRELANGIQIAIRKGQEAGLHPDVKVIAGPAVTVQDTK